MPFRIQLFSAKTVACIFLFLAWFACRSQHKENGEHSYTNELIQESSPYLLQHAHNPVDWKAWNNTTLQKAKAENKLLLISIGYSACHWCHVMEHESFEDTVVANFMNRHFTNIKVDREERPDVDDIYMSACQLATQDGCGWPLNAFALPDGRPVWAGTYFPKKHWLEILEYFKDEWQKNPEKMQEYADQLTHGLSRLDDVAIPKQETEFTEKDLDKIASNFLKRIDFKKGGRKGAPKFPIPNNFQFLLEYYHLTGNEDALKAVTVTLDGIANGGIYDHLGGGFARYSTDENWLVPHFEKMLYDNAQLVSLYSQAYQVTHNPLYKKVVEETLHFLSSEMTSGEGAFYSSLDADSEGEEGKYYVWRHSEIDSILSDEKLSALFSDVYVIKTKGNWEHGKNILHRKQSMEELAKKHSLSVQEINEHLLKAKEKLRKARADRVRPGLDDKSLTAWNALMLKAYADAHRAFGEKSYLDAALQNGQFILEKMMNPDGRLQRNYKNGKSVINAFLDDYALTIDAFIGLYQVTFDEKWLYHAKLLAEYAEAHFYDIESGLFFYASDLDPPLATRKMEINDNVIPASNSVMARDLHLLGLYFYNNAWLEKSKNMMHLFAQKIIGTDEPDFYSNWCQLYLDLARPPYEVAIVGYDFETKRNEMLRHYLPNAILLGGENEGSLELLKGKKQEGETMIYVCRNKICKLPVKDVAKALELMK